VASAAVAAVMATARLAVAAQGHVGRFVVAGTAYVDPRQVPSGIPVVSGQGYDGQLYYRMALAPFNLSWRAFGIRMDTSARFGRVMYPLLSYFAAGGRTGAVPWSMVVVNIVGLGALGWMGATAARDGGRSVWWGLLLPASFGFLWTLSRDLTEITEAAFLVGGLLALRRNRPVVAGLLLAGAVLAREPALLAVACIFVTQATRWWRRGRDRSVWRAAPAWAIPAGAFVAWQLTVFGVTGRLPVRSSGAHNAGLPLVGVVDGVRHYALELPRVGALLWFGEIAVLALLVVGAAVSLRQAAIPTHERVAWVGYLVLAVCLASGIWLGDVGFRSLDDVYVMSVLVLLGAPRWRPIVRVAPLALGATWVVVAVELVRFV
jgi:hypothetical protein